MLEQLAAARLAEARQGMEMAHHQTQPNRQKTQRSQPQLRLSNAEIRRAADTMFKLVQERIIQERRRIGRM